MKPKSNIWFLYRVRCAVEGVGDYFGITTRPLRRGIEHLRKQSGYKLRAAIELYGPEHFLYEVICRCDSEAHARALEKENIKKFNTAWPNGLNVASTGGGTFTYKTTREERRQAQIAAWEKDRRREIHSARLKRAMNTPQAKERSSLAAKRRWADPEYRRKHVEAGKRLHHSEATKKKLRQIKLAASAARGGRKRRSKYPGLTQSERCKLVHARPEVREKFKATWEKNREKNLKTIKAANAIHNRDPEAIANRAQGIKRAAAERGPIKLSDETRRKMSETHTLRWARIRQLRDEQPKGNA